MNRPSMSGLTLLVWQTGHSGNRSIDLASVRPFAARVVLAENGSGSHLLGALRGAFPGIEVEHLRLAEGASPDSPTRQLQRCLGEPNGWVLALEAGAKAFVTRSFRIPEDGPPRSAIHLPTGEREAHWAPVLAPNDPGLFRVDGAGRITLEVDLEDTQCTGDLAIRAQSSPASSRKLAARELSRALAGYREKETFGLALEIGECHFTLGSYTEAAFWYRRSLDHGGGDKQRWTARYRRALSLSAAGEGWPAVEAEMAAAFDLDPSRAEPLYHIARHYHDTGNYSKAHDLSRFGLEIELPRTRGWFEYPVYQYELALLYMSCAERLGHDRDCIRTANRLLRRPGVPDAARTDAAGHRSRCLERIHPVYPLNIRRKNAIVVVTTFRNAGESLARCIDSLGAQAYLHCRFVLIDDASTDGTADRPTPGDLRFVVKRNGRRQGTLRNQIDAVTKHCSTDDIVVYVDGDDRLVDAGVLDYVNDFFNSTRCWIMYGQYRDSDGRLGWCEPVCGESPDMASTVDEMRFPMHIRAHRAGLVHHLLRIDPELTQLRGRDGDFLDSVADMALMRALMQLAGPDNTRYNDRVLYEYNKQNPESHYSDLELRRLQDRQSSSLSSKEPLDPVSWYAPDTPPTTKPGPPRNDTTKLLFIALDGMSPDLVREWSQWLPNLTRLLGKGWTRDVKVPNGFGDDVFWISLATGTLPDEAGYYFRIHWDAERYDFKLFDPANNLDVQTFWSELTDSDMEIAVIDFPETRRAGPVNGLEVAEWMTHARISPARFWPEALESDWTGRFGNDPLNGCTETMKNRSSAQFVEVRDRLLESVGQKTRAALHYLGRGGWDLFAVAYSQAHDMGHQFWHVHDPAHPRHRPTWLERYGDPLLQAYQSIDRAVGELIKGAGRATEVVAVVGLAIEAKVSCNAALDRVLWEIERTEYGHEPGARRPERDQRSFFAVQNNNLSGAVRINLRGRERSGLVEPGAEYEATLDRIERCLRQVVNADTGEPIASDFIRIRDVYRGPRVDALPDMVVPWNRKSPVERIRSPWFESIRILPRDVPDTRTGDHICKAEMLTSFEPPFPEGEPVPVEHVAPWLKRSLVGARQ